MKRTIPIAKPSITSTEIEYVKDAVTNGWGENCYDYLHKFKDQVKSYFNSSYALPTSSCHGALHLILMALGIGPGDEVIVPDSTWVGSVFPISWTGAKPIFVDVRKDTWCIDPQKIEQKISTKTKAVIVVHLYGNLCEMDELMDIGERYGLPIIEDAAEALGSEYKGRKTGSIADFGVFSFHGTKTITTGEGGLLITNRKDMEEKLYTIDNQGRKAGAKYFWVDEIGLKYKMSNLQAALGTAQFQRAKELVQAKRKIFNWYLEAFKDANLNDIQTNYEQEYAKNSYWMPTIVFGNTWSMGLEKRDQLITAMNKFGINLRPFFYPVSGFPMYTKEKDNIVSSQICCSGVNLPSFYDMTKQDVQYVVRHMADYLIELN
ncbi:MAG: DegT/DnrJ/EryC1/StrS family aminotransferase [Desulfobacter sp.]|nr:MAG: DegT/DnrJ/EryC1/StrS family aminotransferase [Desulfobacter sp.]